MDLQIAVHILRKALNKTLSPWANLQALCKQKMNTQRIINCLAELLNVCPDTHTGTRQRLEIFWCQALERICVRSLDRDIIRHNKYRLHRISSKKSINNNK